MNKDLILIAEDNPIVLDVICDQIKILKYDYLNAINGKDAISIYSQKKDNIILIIMDWFMPGMLGEDIIKELLNINKDVKILISTGHDIEDIKAALKIKHLDNPNIYYIQKPFAFGNLREIIRNILQEKDLVATP